MATIVNPEAIEREVSIADIQVVAAELQEALGQNITIYLAGLKDPKMVGRWASGSKPTEKAEMRLRKALHVVRILEKGYGTETAKAWLWGSNSRMNYEAPAWVLRHADDLDDLRPLVPAAISFVTDAG